jgi:hypothetical protein
MLPDPETTQEVAKATKAVADASGKLIEASKSVGQFIARFIAGPLEQGMGIFEDRLKYMRWDRQLRLMKRAEEVIAERGYEMPSRAVPMKVAIPLFQGASMEEDDSLQDRWVNLLVNAAYVESGLEIRRAYIEILAQMDSMEAQILDKIYTLPFAETHTWGLITMWLPERAEIATEHNTRNIHPPEPVCAALANLVRLGCIKSPNMIIGGEFLAQVYTTRLGRDFVAACRQPPEGASTQPAPD